MLFSKDVKTTVKIEGMHCEHCAMKVKNALEALEVVSKAKVNLKEKEAVVSSKNELDNEAVKKAISEVGFEVVNIK